MAQHHPRLAVSGRGAALPETPPRSCRMLHGLGRRGHGAQLPDAERGVLHERLVSPQSRSALPGSDGG